MRDQTRLQPGLWARTRRSLASWAKSGRTAIYGAASLVATLALASSGMNLWRAQEQNTRLKQIVECKDLKVDPLRDSESLVLTRVRYLDSRDRHEEAQTLIDAAMVRLGPDAKAALYYNHSNALIARAIDRIERSDLDGAIPLVNLAKDGYRRALRLQPGNFDIKHNYDVALRLVRDFPPGGPDGEDETATPKKLWTDLPCVPKGLP